MKPEALFDHEQERRVLSLISDTSCLEGPGAARLLLERQGLHGEDFHAPAHGAVFDAMVSTLKRDLPAEAIALWEAVRSSAAVEKAGGLPWLVKLLVNEGHVTTAFPAYAKAVRDLALRRRMFLVARSLQQAAADLGKEPGAVLAEGSAGLAALVRRDEGGRTLLDVLQAMVDEMEANAKGTREPVLPTGIEKLDEVIGGLQPTLTIIGALPGVGKSALLATIAQNLGAGGVRVGVFSLEDQAQWLGYRLLSQHSGVTQFVLRHARMNEYQLGAVHDGLEAMWRYSPNILIDDRVGLSPQEVANTARDMVLNRGARAILVDHLGELKYGNKRERFDLEVAEGLSELRAIAKQHGVPVVCATHLGRGAQERTDGSVKLTDFANSAAIERQARVALGLSRKPGDGRLVVYVLKQTNGVAGVRINLDFHGPAALVKRTGGTIDSPTEAA